MSYSCPIVVLYPQTRPRTHPARLTPHTATTPLSTKEDQAAHSPHTHDPPSSPPRHLSPTHPEPRHNVESRFQYRSVVERLASDRKPEPKSCAHRNRSVVEHRTGDRYVVCLGSPKRARPTKAPKMITFELKRLIEPHLENQWFKIPKH